MMITGGKTYSRASLALAIREKFGKDTAFYTCSATGMNPEELIEFLAQKGKFTGTEEAFSFDPGLMCQGH